MGDYTEVPDISEDPDRYLEVPGTEAPVTPEPEKKVYGPGDVGLVLSGGGGKGAYQIGVLRALQEEGCLSDVKAVAGTSIGAINAVLYAHGDFDKAYQTWDDIDMGVLFDFDPTVLAEGKLYFSRDEMNRLMNNYIDYDKIASCDKDIYCGVAEELGGDQYRAEYLKLNGKSVDEIKKILMASTAMPIVYDTVLINGKHYRDGGVVDNEPIRPLYDAGLRKFIVIGLNYGRTFSSEEFPDAEFIVIDPTFDLGDVFTGTLNFGKADKSIKRTMGYKDGRRAVKIQIEKNDAYIALAPALSKRDYEETVAEYEREQRVSKLENSVNSSLDYIAELEKKYQ
ncbi:MAG: patatin-like phospholipase family protein [Eubacterium sp.]|nr:patatin-like phospholipase family protein [Eubacterium sp.]